MSDNNQMPMLPKGEVELLADNANKTIQRMQAFSHKFVPELAKNSTKFNSLYNSLIVDQMSSNVPMEMEGTSVKETAESEISASGSKGEPELSVHGQVLLSDSLNSIKKCVNDMSQEHKHAIHHLVSKCGKGIDSRFYSDLNKLLKNEKEIECDPDNLKHANRLILEHLMGLGRTEVAETFLKESEMSLKLPKIEDFETLKQVMSSFRQHDYLPAIHWVREHASHRGDLLFRLQCQHIIYLLKTQNGSMEALEYVRGIQTSVLDQYKQELANLMFVVMSYPRKAPYEYLFHEGRWFALEKDLAHTLTDYRSSLATILSAGAKTVPSLMTMRAFLSSARPGSFPTLPDELPCNVPIPEQVHSSFCCPILKVQSTESNPPVRLCCGHVISTEAMSKLAQQSRNNRLKCPYCPLESVMQETKVLHF